MTPGKLNFIPLREQVYNLLREQLHSGELSPGDFINIQDITGALGVSTTPLRDALIHLEVQGFVTIIPRKGIKINRLSLQDIKEGYHAMGMVEAAAVLDHFRYFTPKRLNDLAAINRELKKAVLTARHKQVSELDLAFHHKIMAASDNELEKKWICPVMHRLCDLRSLEDQKWKIAHCMDHGRFIDALLNGKPEEAAAVLKDHRWNFKAQGQVLTKLCPA